MSLSSKPARAHPQRAPTSPGEGAGTVSPTSAQRFAARVRARRRNRLLIVAAVLILLAGAGWVALKSPWATVRSIQVSGTHRVSAQLVAAQALSQLGRPLVLARTGQVAALVAAQPLVREVRVQRHWPSGLRIRVREREPVAVLPADGRLDLVDGDGVLVEQVAAGSAPAALPVIQVDLATAGVAALRGCLSVLHALPPSVSGQLAAIGADTPDGIWLRLRSGARVQWGSAADTPLKATVLVALLPQHAANYDVQAPDTPAVSGKVAVRRSGSATHPSGR